MITKRFWMAIRPTITFFTAEYRLDEEVSLVYSHHATTELEKINIAKVLLANGFVEVTENNT